MKIVNLLPLLLSFVAFLLCGCSDDDKQEEIVSELNFLKGTEFSVSIKADGGSASTLVNSTSSISLHTIVDWVSTSVTEVSENTYSVQIDIAANSSANERKTAVTIENEDGIYQLRIEVVQAGKRAVIEAKELNEVAKLLGIGWNLGNHFDSYGMTKYSWWDLSTPSQSLYDKLKEYGFSSVRIPVTWYPYMGAAPDYTIESKYLDLIESNVSMALKSGLAVVINIHHDGAESKNWLDIKGAAKSAERNDTVKAEIKAVWTQIANRFADFDESLVFEGFNELHDGGWGWGDNRKDGGKQYAILNEWNQLFVDVVRGTGGNNATRYLSVPAYSTNIDLAKSDFVLPKDVVSDKLILSVHFYDPYNFTLEDSKSEWGHTGDASKKVDGSDETYVLKQFKVLYDTFVKDGVPVYIGEFGCVRRSDSRSEQFRRYWLEYIVKAAKTYSLPLMYWDNNAKETGLENSGVIDHSTGSLNNSDSETVVNLMTSAWNKDDEEYTIEWVYDNQAPE